MQPVMIPTLLFWENKNSWYGSKGLARFFIKPTDVEQEDGTTRTRLLVELWKGPLTKQLSEVIATADFPVSEEGLEETVAWLEARAAELNSNQKTPE